LKSLPGSDLQFTRAQISNRYGPADWFPGDHPVMPNIVAYGKVKAETRACGLCHMPNGKGRPENAGVAGLPVQYFIQQLNDFRDGKRKTSETSEPRKGNVQVMIDIAKSLTEEEMVDAAEYFGSMPWTPWIRVVETETVPKMRIQGGIHIPLAGNEREPIGNRIIETPENPEHTEVLRDPRSGFIAYVPVGAVKKGEALVTTGGGKITRCGVCHGPDLKGLGPVPGIAGRSPSYMMRQLWDMKTGARTGEWTRLMAPVVAPLSEEELMNVVAYVSSRQP
jgi:cytochrome c553